MEIAVALVLAAGAALWHIADRRPKAWEQLFPRLGRFFAMQTSVAGGAAVGVWGMHRYPDKYELFLLLMGGMAAGWALALGALVALDWVASHK